MPLQSLVKLELLSAEPADRVKEIWTEHHKGLDAAVGMVVHPDALDRIIERGRRAPHFVFPVFRGGGFVNLVSNSLPEDQRAMFANLEDFRANPAMAESYLTLAFYADLVETKGVALVRGDFSPAMEKAEAEYLLNSYLHFYTSDVSFDWVDSFDNRPADFDFDKYLDFYKSMLEDKGGR